MLKTSDASGLKLIHIHKKNTHTHTHKDERGLVETDSKIKLLRLADSELVKRKREIEGKREGQIFLS